MQNRGWVKLWREQFTHPISERKPWCDGYAWAFLYSQANYKRGIANFRNQYVPIERGQFVTSISKLSKIFGWTRKRTKAFLISLQNEEMITLKSGTNWDQKGTPSGYTRRDSRFSILTIRNYDKFQSTEEVEGAAEVEAEGIAEAQQERTIKEVKKKRNLFVEDSEPLRLAQFLLQEILKNKPTLKRPNLQTWAGDIDLLLRRDGRTPKRIREVISWTQGDSFWWRNILSARKLREQFDTLEARMPENGGGRASW